MNKIFKLIYLILILSLNYSCVKKKSSQKEIPKSEFVNASKTDTLKFNSGIRSILQDNEGNYWLGSHREGVCLFNGKTFEYFTTKDGLSGNQIRSIQEDEYGNIWFGTGSGVSSYDGKIITNYTPITDYNLENERKNEVNNLWFNAGNSAGVYRNDSLTLNYIPFPLPKNVNHNESYGVTGVTKGMDDKVWIGTYSALYYFNGKAIKVFDKSKLALDESEVLHIRSVLADSQGRIWVGNNGIGVLLVQENSKVNFSDKNGLIHKVSSKNGNASPAGTLEHVFAIEEDSEGNIWFGDRDTGPWKYDGKTMTNYTIDNKLLTPMIWCIYNDKNNNLLFGMADGGVYKFNGKSFDKQF